MCSINKSSSASNIAIMAFYVFGFSYCYSQSKNLLSFGEISKWSLRFKNLPTHRLWRCICDLTRQRFLSSAVIVPGDTTEVLTSASQTTHPVQPFDALSLVVSGLTHAHHVNKTLWPPGTPCPVCTLAPLNNTLHAYLLPSPPPPRYPLLALCLSLITLRQED